MPASRMNARAAFSLVELLVIVAILVLLIAILLPSLGRVRSQARSAVCASNLHQLAAAANAYRAASFGSLDGGVHSNRWIGQFRKVLSSRKAFVCPEGTLHPQTGVLLPPGQNPGPAMAPESGQALAEAVAACIKMNGYSSRGATTASWTDLYMIKHDVKGPPLTGFYDGSSLQVYSPHNSDWCLEDGVNGTSDDCIIRIVDNYNGTLTLTYVSQHTGSWRYDIFTADGDPMIMGMGSGGDAPPGKTLTIIVYNGVGGMASPLAPAPMPDTFYYYIGSASYGMNKGCNPPGTPPGSLIYLMDYTKTEIDPDGDLARWQSAGQADSYQTTQGQYIFARHLGKANVAWFDGSVSAVSPTTVQPSTAEVKTRYWFPN